MDTSRVTSGNRPYQTVALLGFTLAERMRAVFEGLLIDTPTRHTQHLPSLQLRLPTEQDLRGIQAYACSGRALDSKPSLPAEDKRQCRKLADRLV